MFLFLHLTLLIAKKTNTSVVVIGCREKHNIYKSFDMHFNLDNKEYSLTLEKYREENEKAKEWYVCSANTFRFLQLSLVCGVCLSVRAKREHLYMTSTRLTAILIFF